MGPNLTVRIAGHKHFSPTNRQKKFIRWGEDGSKSDMRHSYKLSIIPKVNITFFFWAGGPGHEKEYYKVSHETNLRKDPG